MYIAFYYATVQDGKLDVRPKFITTRGAQTDAG